MSMENFKIRIFLERAAVLDRLLTIDSVLLNLHYGRMRGEGKILKNKFVSLEDDLENVHFLEKRHGVLSGSIWYVPEDSPLFLENLIVNKYIDTERYRRIKKKNFSIQNGEFKAYRVGIEALVTPEIYFYVRGNGEYIESLLSELSAIGKKRSIGYGRVAGFEMERMAEDKSFLLDGSTPAKPLPVSSFSIDTKKVAFYRPLPPSYQKEGRVPCYMPTFSLVERKDETSKNPNFVFVDMEFVSPTRFARESMKHLPDLSERELKFSKKVRRTDRSDRSCCMCGQSGTAGFEGNPKRFFSNNFNDFGFLSEGGGFICEDCVWSIKREKSIGNTLITKEGAVYLQGKNMSVKTVAEQRKFREEFFRNIDLLRPPFLISFKSTANTQHTVFKNSVSISNALISISYGNDDGGFVDVELLKEAIEEAERIIRENKCIKKAYLTNLEKIDGNIPSLSSKCATKENYKVLSDFYKKYDRGVRKILSRIVF